MLLPAPMLMIELDCNVNAPMPAVLLLAPCSERPPVLNVPPFNVIVELSLIRSTLAVPDEFESNNVPPALTVMFVVAVNRGVVDPALSTLSVPLLIVVVPV